MDEKLDNENNAYENIETCSTLYWKLDCAAFIVFMLYK